MRIMKPEIKALLIEIGSIAIDPAILGYTTIPTAGPGAGKLAFFFNNNKMRVRLGVNASSPLKGKIENDQLVIFKNNKEVIRGNIEEELIHCPEQAFITMSEKCIYNCKFCPVPKLQGKVKSIDEIIEMIDKANNTGKMKAISITSGVEISPEHEVNRAIKLISKLRQKYDLPIGVSVYPTADSTARLKYAGANELKYNVETMDIDLYNKLCPGTKLENILIALEEGVKIFGKNKVCSNFIIGLGETDETVKQGIERLVSIGVVPILRAANTHPLIAKDVFITRPSAERILMLTRFLKDKLDENGLHADIFETMCLPCMGCDINPHIDL